MPDKFIREIEEILEREERPAPGVDSKATGKNGSRRSRFLYPISSIYRLNELFKPSRVMLAGIILLLVAVLLNAVIPGRVHLLVWAGLVLFVIAYGLFFVRPGFQYEKRWRGRLVEDRVPLLDRLRRWLRG